MTVSIDRQQTARDFVYREVGECVSQVVYAMAQHEPDESYEWYEGNIDLDAEWYDMSIANRS